MHVTYEPLSPQYRADPFPVYRDLRDHDPVHFAPESKCYCVSRYEDVLSVLKNPEQFSSRAMFTMLMNGGEEAGPTLSWDAIKFLFRYAIGVRLNPFMFVTARNLIAADAPEHGPMRGIVNRGFTPQQMASWEPRIREIVAEQIAPLAAGDCYDVVRDLAIPVPVRIIAEMLGVEAERVADFKRWSDGIISGATGERRSNRFHPETVRTILELNGYLRKIILERRRHPADDLISTILAAETDGDALSVIEIVLFVQLLLLAGNETTTNLIGNAATALLDNPDQLDRVNKDPALIPGALDETLRFESPIQLVFRTARGGAEIAGTPIPDGAVVALLLGSANRDERQFDSPDTFDIERKTQGHLGFGFGAHFCLGSSLAKLQARVALEGLVPHLPRLQRRTTDRKLVDSFLVRGSSRLELDARASM
jgi:cytochrome P450